MDGSDVGDRQVEHDPERLTAGAADPIVHPYAQAYAAPVEVDEVLFRGARREPERVTVEARHRRESIGLRPDQHPRESRDRSRRHPRLPVDRLRPGRFYRRRASPSRPASNAGFSPAMLGLAP